MTQSGKRLAIVLVHYPVLNKGGEVIGSAVTNLDLHDIARVARTYGIEHYYVATPYRDQRELVEEIVGHWETGHGATYNPARKEALSIIRPVGSLDEAIERVEIRCGEKPFIVSTSAKRQGNGIGYVELRERLDHTDEPVLLLFGTAHGLAPEVLERADAALPPIQGKASYNHLSVRSAVSIILDRLLGR